MKFEIRAIGPGDSTTSGPLEMSREEAQALFDADALTLDPGSTLELSEYQSGKILQRVTK